MNHRQGSITGELFTRILILVLGLIMLIPAANQLYRYCKLQFLGIHAMGTVIHSSSSRDWGGRPLIQYEDQNGSLYEFKSKVKTHWFTRPVKGEKIEVLFDRADSSRVIVDSIFYYVIVSLIFMTAGCYCCLRSIWIRRPVEDEIEA
ncbi:MAG: hypothetical protein QNJ17_13740 [Desulfocapsaceae bacterium]|nr:hypothetical protein [Desulfocapsaceae bacterium]